MQPSNPSPLITISNAQLYGFIAMASQQYGVQSGLLAQYMQYGDKAARPLANKLVVVNSMIKNLNYIVKEIRALITFEVPNDPTLTSSSLSITGYGAVGTTAWEGNQTATALNLANQINLGGIFFAYSVEGYVVVDGPVGAGSSFNGTGAVLTNVFTTYTGAINASTASSGVYGTGSSPFSITLTFNTPGYFGGTFSFTASESTFAATQTNLVNQINSDTRGFKTTDNSFFPNTTAPSGYGTIPNSSWYIVASGSAVSPNPSAFFYFHGGSYGTPVTNTTTQDFIFANGLNSTTYCLNYSQVFEMMEFISKALGFCYDINQTPPLN